MSTETLENPEASAATLPVTPKDQPSLSSVFTRELTKLQTPTEKAAAEAGTKVDDTKPPVEKEPAKVDKAEKQPERKPDAAPAAKKSPLDAVLDDTKPAVEKDKTEEAIPENAGAKQLREAYERQKSEAVKWKGEYEKLSGKVKEGDPNTKQQIESFQQEKSRLEKENRELRDAVTALNVEYDPQFREKYVVGISKIMQKTEKFVEQYGGDPKAFREAMEYTGKARTEALRNALDGVDELDRPMIYQQIAKMRELEEERAETLQNSQQSYEKLSQAQQEKARAQNEQIEAQKRAIFEGISKALPQKHPLLRNVPTDIEGADEWNSRVQADMAKALKSLSSEADWDSINEVAIKGARYDHVEELLLSERKEVARLRAELEQYQRAEPGFTGRTKTESANPLDKSPGTLYKETLAKLSHRD